MKKPTLLLGLALVLVLATAASAIDKTGKMAIGGYAGYSFGFGDVFKKHVQAYHYDLNSNTQLKVTFSSGVEIKYGLTKNIAVSLALNYQGTKKEIEFFGEKKSVSGHWPAFLVNGILISMPEGKTCPYLTGGVGLYIRYEKKEGEGVERPSDTDFKPGINLGGGVEQFLQDDLALDGGARLHLIFGTEDDIRSRSSMTTYLQIFAGINFYPF